MKNFVLIFVKSFKISLLTKGVFSVAVSILGFAFAFLPLLISLQLRSLTDRLQALYGAGASQVHTAIVAFALLALLYIIKTLFQFIQDYCTDADNIRVRKHLKTILIKCSCEVKYKYIENFDGFTEKLQFIDTFSGKRVADSIQSTIIWLQNLVVGISLVILLGGISHWIVIAILLSCIPSFISAYKYNDEEFFNLTQWMVDAHWGYHYFHIAGHPKYKPEIRFLGLHDFMLTKWKTYTKHHHSLKNKLRKKFFFFNSLSDLVRNGVLAVVLIISALHIYDNPALGLGLFMLVYTTSTQLQDVLLQLFVKGAQFAGDVKYMKSYFELDHLEYDKLDDNALPLERMDIEFDNVGFTYPNASFEALSNLSVCIKQGEKIAIVGENGSEKTTFTNILCGMFSPDSGTVKVNGIIASEQLPQVRKSISSVFQDFCRYEATLRDNITISDRKRAASDKEIFELAKQIGAEDLILQQPDGLDEMIGLFSERGNNLSGGQWQKVAIMRAAYRSSACLMVLDEPTAALDPMAEAQLYTAFSKLAANKTTILISHRLGVTSVVDRILVFDKGTIVEDGSHANLIAYNGKYAEMYRAQAQWYTS